MGAVRFVGKATEGVVHAERKKDMSMKEKEGKFTNISDKDHHTTLSKKDQNSAQPAYKRRKTRPASPPTKRRLKKGRGRPRNDKKLLKEHYQRTSVTS